MRCALIVAATMALSQPFVWAGDQSVFYLRAQHIEREFFAGPYWRTVAIRSTADGWTLKTRSDELEVELADGRVVKGEGWELLGKPQVRQVGETRALTVRLGAKQVDGLQATITYRLRTTQTWMYKQVRISGPAGLVVSRVDLEPMSLQPSPADHGGEGMPVLVGGRCWFGVEYPASRNSVRGGRLSLVHFPGKKLGREEVECKTAVCGVAPPGQAVQMAFEDYLDATVLPPRLFLHYNSWYDLRGRELSPANLLKVYEGFRTGLLDPYKVGLAAVVIDDGWQERKSIWRPRADLYPQGFGPLARELEARGTRLGLWMPLSGFNLDVQWGASQGYEKSSGGRWYCLAGPRFFAAMRDATARLIREGNLAYYKHDFNFLRCEAEGHGHLPTREHGREANVDRTIALLKYERQLQPQIFLNVTSGMWYSPWWLMYADSIWGAFPGDTGYSKSYPQLTRREWAMSFRDVHLYRMYRQRPNNLFPIARLMTHGITQGRYNMLGGANEPLREWSDYVMMYFGRGVQLQELYLSPERMREDMWKAVGLAVRWAGRRSQTLARTVMVGGNPTDGEAYGFIHWKGDQGVWVLRNPGLESASVPVHVSQQTGYRGGAKKLYACVTYPYLAPLPAPVIAGRQYEVDVPPRTVMVVEVRPKPWGEAPASPAVSARTGSRTTASVDAVRTTARATIRARRLGRVRLYVVLRGGAVGPCRISCGQTVAKGSASGPGWHMEMRELPEGTGQVAATIEIPSPPHKPFSRRPGSIQAWVVYEVASERAKLLDPPQDLPWAIADGWRRRSTKLVDCRLSPPQQGPTMRRDQMGMLKAVRLHLEVFGVNAGQYADKWILFNGHRLARVPFNNQASLDRWEEKVIEFKPDQLGWVREVNEVVFTNEPSDCYKVRNIALAVQLPDGTWAESNWDEEVYCSVAKWLYTEGKVFKGGKSAAIRLRMPVK